MPQHGCFIRRGMIEIVVLEFVSGDHCCGGSGQRLVASDACLSYVQKLTQPVIHILELLQTPIRKRKANVVLLLHCVAPALTNCG
jgi:hypothetical protein